MPLEPDLSQWISNNPFQNPLAIFMKEWRNQFNKPLLTTVSIDKIRWLLEDERVVYARHGHVSNSVCAIESDSFVSVPPFCSLPDRWVERFEFVW